MYLSQQQIKDKLYYNNPDVSLFLADCLDIMKNIKDNSVDMIFADPPYFLSRKKGITYNNGKVISVYKGEWDETCNIEKKLTFNIKWIHECYRILKNTGTIWITGSKHNIYSVGVALEKEEFQIINNIAWVKNNATPNISKRVLSFDNETILWAKKCQYGGYVFNYEWLRKENNFHAMTDVWNIPVITKVEKKFGKHPTQKPEKLLERIIVSSTAEGMLILDPFAGSSTTGVVAIKNKRKFIGIEKEEKYISISKRRILDI